MNALLIVSHGSRRQASNLEVADLADNVRSLLKDRFQLVVPAFLELAKPSIPEGIELCITQGAKQILVIPYFLAAGRHVSEHIPEIIYQAQSEHPNITIRLAGHIGGSDFMARLVVDHSST